MLSSHANLLEQKNTFPLVWNTNMAAISLFWNTNMVDLTSRENALEFELSLKEVSVKSLGKVPHYSITIQFEGKVFKNNIKCTGYEVSEICML